jgi:hypothetical protein
VPMFERGTVQTASTPALPMPARRTPQPTPRRTLLTASLGTAATVTPASKRPPS